MAIEYYHLHENDTVMVDQLLDLEEEVHGEGALSLFEVFSYMRYGRVYAAMEYDELLGCTYFLKDFDNPNRVFLYGFVIKPSEAGKNLAQNLIKTAMADLRDSGVRIAEVAVNPANEKAIQVYEEELGFAPATPEDKEETDYLILRKAL